MSEAATSTPQNADERSQTDETTGESGQGWLERVLARIGFGDSPEGVREMIEEALEKDVGTEEGFSPQERAMLVNLLRFGDLRIEDVMVPRADITAVEEQTPLAELLEMFQKAGHSRLPVFRGTLDNPRGMLHIKDLMSWITRQALAAPEDDKAAAGVAAGTDAAPARSIRLERVDVTMPLAKAEILRDVLFVPPSMSVRDLLLRMQTTHVHLALVVDEYGGTDGLVSIEDLVEEIVGEIEDEHDRNGGPLITDDPDRGLIADARVPIQELEEHMGVSLMPPERGEDVDTLGGLVFTLAGRIPVRGEVVRHASGVEFEVLEADPRRIRKIRIHGKRLDGGQS